MKKFTMVAISLAVFATSNAFAQSKTRAEVYRELIEAQQNGLNYVTDTSYPEVDPIYTAQVSRTKQGNLIQQNAAGKVPRGMSATTAN
ncbi:DUF4148 domain-containing protein [Paraburkholderia sp. RP-4-7]|uniref:DUF4148 domain-containing protein n=1 Tax=Paraburkholderia polaris TaxID=2728848 RepID=A0A848I839_9BURK|nr:DUF4148 domain-containing protein [Paraburkholderia polaris]NML97599.1 DUF4148 domain-containing protein [Paraburkholderia polaris]